LPLLLLRFLLLLLLGVLSCVPQQVLQRLHPDVVEGPHQLPCLSLDLP
jgi:hypothetical protein